MYFVKTTHYLEGRVGLGRDSPIKYACRLQSPITRLIHTLVNIISCDLHSKQRSVRFLHKFNFSDFDVGNFSGRGLLSYGTK